MSRFVQTAAMIRGPYGPKPKRGLGGTEADPNRTAAVNVNLSKLLGKGLHMKLLNIFKRFKNDEAGAVTVDWVVLTAAIVGLGLVVMNTIRPGIEGAADVIASDLEDAASR
jgi:Flp pilus assembly pilin Flp